MNMAAVFKDLEAQALALPPGQRGALVARLLESLEGTFDDSPEAVAKAWDEEIARRVADFEAGRTQGVPYEQVRAELRAMIDSHSRP
jgi:putative addiction module component (TIGR02574 family)